MKWTFLRDTDFMDNWLPSARWEMKTYRTVLLRLTFHDHPDRKIVLVSTRDIGRGGALAFAEPEKWQNKLMPLAGDVHTISELEKVYKEVMGEPITETWGIIASLAKWAEPTLAQLSNVSNNKREGASADGSSTATRDTRSGLRRPASSSTRRTLGPSCRGTSASADPSRLKL